MGSALAFSLFELARHPHVQELVVQELYEVFGDDQRVPSLTDLRRLTYLEQCIKETLRMYPSVPLIFRMLTEDAKLGTARPNNQSADQQISSLLWDPVIHYYHHKSLTLDPTLNS